MLIIPTCGLGNRLRVIFSYIQLAQSKHEHMTVVWTRTTECPGLFLDLFQPIPNVNFIQHVDPSQKIFYKGWAQHEKFEPDYKFLRPVAKLQQIINYKIRNLKRYVAVHIRRTDLTRLAKIHNQFTNDQIFINFLKQYPNHNIYLATDNAQTQQQFYRLFRTRIKQIPLISTKNKNLRKTSIEQAIIDIFVCSRANHFKGTSYSSFSHLIYHLIEQRKQQYLTNSNYGVPIRLVKHPNHKKNTKHLEILNSSTVQDNQFVYPPYTINKHQPSTFNGLQKLNYNRQRLLFNKQIQDLINRKKQQTLIMSQKQKQRLIARQRRIWLIRKKKQLITRKKNIQFTVKRRLKLMIKKEKKKKLANLRRKKIINLQGARIFNMPLTTN